MTRAQIARDWMHARLCISDTCDGDSHARRTQQPFARDAVRAARAGHDLAPIIHHHTCLGCADRYTHVQHLRDAAVELAGRLG